MKNENTLQGKAIVITGASSGAGRAAALEFAKHQTWLILAARNESALSDVAKECRQLGAVVYTLVTDVTQPGDTINLANEANDFAGKVDVWINNAGVLAAGEFEVTPMEVHARVIRTNLLGYMNGAHAILPIFKKQGYGIIVNNISIGGYMPVPFATGYSASKFGLRGFSEALKAELSTWPNIHICDLYPAFLDTPGIQHAANYTGKLLKPAPPVYDPQRLAQAMVKVANDPKSSLSIGSITSILRMGHALFPSVVNNITGAFIRKYFKVAVDIPPTDGNLFNTVDYSMSPYGGFGFPGKPKAHRKYIAGALLAGMAAGLFLVMGKK